MKPNKPFLYFFTVLAVAALACNGILPGQNPVNSTPPPLEDIDPSLTEIPATEVVVEANTCTGPGIVETEVNGQKGVVRVDAGLSMPYTTGDSWCAETNAFPDQNWLNDRWPTHLQEYFAKPENVNAKAYILLESGSLQPYDPNAPDALATPIVPLLPDVASMVTAAAGQLAWHQDPKGNGELHSASPVGQLGSGLPIIAETWGQGDNGDTSYVVVVPPGAVAWFQNHYGGTGWWLSEEVNAEEIANQHADNLEARDGVRPDIVILPEDGFPLLGCLQSKPVNGNERPCDAVGGQPAFNAPANGPFPGYFPEAFADTGFFGSCNNGVATGPAIVETTIGGVPTVVKVNTGATYSYDPKASGCWGKEFTSQEMLDATWPTHSAAFLQKYPNGTTKEVK